MGAASCSCLEGCLPKNAVTATGQRSRPQAASSDSVPFPEPERPVSARPALPSLEELPTDSVFAVDEAANEVLRQEEPQAAVQQERNTGEETILRAVEAHAAAGGDLSQLRCPTQMREILIPVMVEEALASNGIGRGQAPALEEALQIAARQAFQVFAARRLEVAPTAADWASTVMVHGPLAMALQWVRRKDQVRVVCKHWHFGCVLTERLAVSNGRRPQRMVMYTARKGKVTFEDVASSSKRQSGSLIMASWIAFGGGMLSAMVTVTQSQRRFYTLLHIILVFGCIVMLSSYCSSKLSGAGVLRVLGKKHWLFDGSEHWVVMMIIALQFITVGLVVSDASVHAFAFPAPRTAPSFLIALGFLLEDAQTKYDFRTFVKARTGHAPKGSGVVICQPEPPATCPICNQEAAIAENSCSR